MIQSPSREYAVKYRPPHGSEWQELGLDEAMDMIADRVLASRAAGWQQEDEEGGTLNRTMGIGSLGGATLDNEENYLIKKLFSALGIVQIENQARI
jgi:formate dehydrogenase major subunit